MLQFSENSEDEHASFEQICVPLRARMVAYAHRRTGDRQRAEDIVHDALIRAYEAWPRWRRSPKFRRDADAACAWLYRCVANVANNAYEREQHFRRIVVDLDQEAFCEQSLNDEDDLSDEVRIAMASLLPHQREVVEMIYIEGLSVADVARALTISVGTVGSRLTRARKTLKESLSKYAKANYHIDAFNDDDCGLAEAAAGIAESRAGAVSMLQDECGWTRDKAKCVLDLVMSPKRRKVSKP